MPESDFLASAAELDAAAVERMNTLRAQLAELEQQTAQRRTALADELGDLEARWKEAATQKAREEQAAAALAAYETIRADYDQLATNAVEALQQLQKATDTACDAFTTAVELERARDQAAPRLRAAWQRATDHGAPPPELRIDPLRLHSFADTDPIRGIAIAAITRNPSLESADGAVPKAHRTPLPRVSWTNR